MSRAASWAGVFFLYLIWLWINTYENTIFRGMNIHKSQLFLCELQGYKVLTHCHISHTDYGMLWINSKGSWTFMDHDGLTIDYIHDGPMISPQLWDDDINYGTMMIFIMAYNLVHYVPNYDIYDGIFQVPKSFFFLKHFWPTCLPRWFGDVISRDSMDSGPFEQWPGKLEILKGLGDGSKPWYLVNPKIAGKWMFIPLKMYL